MKSWIRKKKLAFITHFPALYASGMIPMVGIALLLWLVPVLFLFLLWHSAPELMLEPDDVAVFTSLFAALAALVLVAKTVYRPYGQAYYKGMRGWWQLLAWWVGFSFILTTPAMVLDSTHRLLSSETLRYSPESLQNWNHNETPQKLIEVLLSEGDALQMKAGLETSAPSKKTKQAEVEQKSRPERIQALVRFWHNLPPEERTRAVAGPLLIKFGLARPAGLLGVQRWEQEADMPSVLPGTGEDRVGPWLVLRRGRLEVVGEIAVIWVSGLATLAALALAAVLSALIGLFAVASWRVIPAIGLGGLAVLLIADTLLAKTSHYAWFNLQIMLFVLMVIATIPLTKTRLTLLGEAVVVAVVLGLPSLPYLVLMSRPRPETGISLEPFALIAGGLLVALCFPLLQYLFNRVRALSRK